MNDKLYSYVESLFSNAPKTKKAMELREELLSDLNEKYNDLVARGVPDEEAYRTVVEGIGDVEELIGALRRDNVFDFAEREKGKKRSALFVSVSVGLYILSIAVLIFCSMINPVNGAEIGVVLMFLIAAVATSLIVYNGITRPRYSKSDNTIVEEFKEWKSMNTDKIQQKKALSSILWPLVVAIYFLYSFFFGAWGYSWIIFIIGVAVDHIIKAVIDFKE